MSKLSHARSLILIIAICLQKIQLSNEDSVSFLTNTPEFIGLNILELVPKHGYQLERHFITSEDGYILETHRILHPNYPAVQPTKPPVLCVPGVGLSSIDFVNGGVNRSLVYALVDLGFDLWLANTRGTKFSRRHVRLNPDIDKKEFWTFSFHEMGVYDNPAMIDYILARGSWEKLVYVGHSQGTTSFFVMNIERPEYAEKILIGHMLGPVAFWSNLMSPPFRYGLPSIEEALVAQQDKIQLYEFLPRTVNEMLWPTVCIPSSPFFQICKFIVGLIFGFDNEQLEDDMIPIITGSLPAGGAVTMYLHFSQLVKNGRFCKFDFRNRTKNIEKYGQPIPPDYDLSKVTAPVAVHYGMNDWLLNYKDAEKTTNMLRNVVVHNKIKYKKFTHGNFLWAKDIFQLLYNDIINITMHYI